jgi:hypothetical protein
MCFDEEGFMTKDLSQNFRIYIPGEALLPHMGRLRFQLCPDPVNNFQEFRRVALRLEYLPYSLGAASHAVFALTRTQRDVVERKAQTQQPGSINELTEEERNLLGYHVDAFLDAARRTQNAVIPYLRRKFPSLSLPNSLSKLVDNLKQNKVSFPQELREGILQYWKEHGQQLKSYRDLGQHYSIVVGEARVFIPETEAAALSLPLPNNPEARSVNQLCYEEPQVNALEFVLEQFFHLIAFCDALTWKLLDPQEERAIIPAFGLRVLLRLGAGGTKFYRPFTENEVREAIKAVLADIHGCRSEAGEDAATT